jgi:penicillin-binding protein-related factor A (putative recombinase)
MTIAKGKLLEKMLSSAHAEYDVKKLAFITQVPNAFTFCGESNYRAWNKKKGMVARTNDGRPLIRMKSDVDFVGTIKDGKAICFDAKEVSSGVSIGLERFSSHQVSRGVSNQNLGAYGGFIVYFIEANRAFWIDAKEVQKLQDAALFKKGKKSININEFQEEIEIKYNRIDWLSLIRGKSNE